jgi:hypothetical protein
LRPPATGHYASVYCEKKFFENLFQRHFMFFFLQSLLLLNKALLQEERFIFEPAQFSKLAG